METQKKDAAPQAGPIQDLPDPEDGHLLDRAARGSLVDSASGAPGADVPLPDLLHGAAAASGGQAKAQRVGNNARRLRMERMMSKAELARRAGVSTLTIDRVERGLSCRMDTKRKIIEALGLKPSDRSMVFAEDE